MLTSMQTIAHDAQIDDQGAFPFLEIQLIDMLADSLYIACELGFACCAHLHLVLTATELVEM